MALMAGDLLRLRQMIADSGDTARFLDIDIIEIAEQYPLDGGVYDLNAAARDLWERKAALLVEAEERFSADGRSFEFGNLVEKALKMAAFYGAKANTLYTDYGYSISGRDDVDPLGEAGGQWRPLT